MTTEECNPSPPFLNDIHILPLFVHFHERRDYRTLLLLPRRKKLSRGDPGHHIEVTVRRARVVYVKEGFDSDSDDLSSGQFALWLPLVVL